VYDTIEFGTWKREASRTSTGAQEHLVGPHSIPAGKLELTRGSINMDDYRRESESHLLVIPLSL
jgi:hypothetical protein